MEKEVLGVNIKELLHSKYILKRENRGKAQPNSNRNTFSFYLLFFIIPALGNIKMEPALNSRAIYENRIPGVNEVLPITS